MKFSSKLQSAVDFSKTIQISKKYYAQADITEHCDDHADKKRIKISGFMNVSRNIQSLNLDTSPILTVDHQSSLDQWIGSSQSPSFLTSNCPKSHWKRNVTVCFDADDSNKLKISYESPVEETETGCPNGSINNKVKENQKVHLITEDSVHSTQYRSLLDFQPLFCFCHLPEDYESDSDISSELSSKCDIEEVNEEHHAAVTSNEKYNNDLDDPTSSLRVDSISVTSENGIVPLKSMPTQQHKSIHDVDSYRGQFVECSVGIAGCNGWMHAGCAGLGHLTEAEISGLVSVVCPLCVWYLEGSGSAKALKNKLAIRPSFISKSPRRLQVNDIDIWESEEEHSIWGHVDYPSNRYYSTNGCKGNESVKAKGYGNGGNTVENINVITAHANSENKRKYAQLQDFFGGGDDGSLLLLEHHRRVLNADFTFTDTHTASSNVMNLVPTIEICSGNDDNDDDDDAAAVVRIVSADDSYHDACSRPSMTTDIHSELLTWQWPSPPPLTTSMAGSQGVDTSSYSTGTCKSFPTLQHALFR